MENTKKAEKLQWLNHLEYTIETKHTQGRFFLFIRELNLVAVHTDLKSAYDDLQQQKQRYFLNLLEAGWEQALVLPTAMSRRNEWIEQIKIFLLKVLIVCLLFGFTFALGGVVVINKLSNISPSDIIKKAGKEVIVQIRQVTDVSPEEEQKRRAEWHKIFQAMKPVVEEYNNTFPQPSKK